MQHSNNEWLPNNPEAEAAVLGAILIDKTGDALAAAIETDPDAFYDTGNRKIFEAIWDLYDADKPIDIVTLAQQLDTNHALAIAGGVTYLSKIAQSVPTAANIGEYVKIVQDQYLRRQIAEAADEQRRAALQGEDATEALATMARLNAQLSDQAAPAQEFKPIGVVMMDAFEQAERRAEQMMKNPNRGSMTGIPSGFVDLDRMTAGWQNNDLIIVAARPSVGKTALALNLAQNAALDYGKSVAIFSLEMSAAQLANRFISADQNLAAEALKVGDLQDEDWQKMAQAVTRFSEAKIFIDDPSVITVHEIRSKCRRLKEKQGLDMIIIDYLQLITGGGRGRRQENRQQEVAEISRTLKQIARELEVPVIALSQLSRGVEQRQDKRPMMSDLRESGSIEQDADIVAFLYRDDYYNADTEKKNIIEIIIAKQRNGPVGKIELVFLKQFNKFVNYDRTHVGYDAGMEKRYG
ncbi:replicative DNA helicase [Saccharibacillus sp. O16]|nr:replicative DNA helicase [Saccharibacillus sp. O16]